MDKSILKRIVKYTDLNLLYSISKDIKNWIMSESNIHESNKVDISKSDLLVVFGVIMPITVSASFLSYKTIVHYFKWKSLDTERKTKDVESQLKCKQLDYESQLKLKQMDIDGKQLDYESQLKCKQLEYESQIKLKQMDIEGKQLDYESQIKLKQLDNESQIKLKNLDPK